LCHDSRIGGVMSEAVPQRIDRSLRDRQRELTRGLIIDALTQIILRDGVSEFSMQSVADEAQCSLRTLYRYFPSRESLLEGLDEEMDAFLKSCFDRLPSAANDDLAVLAERMPPLLVERRDLARAWVAAVPHSRVRETVGGRIRALVAATIDRSAPSLSEDERARAFVALRLIANSRSWLTVAEQLPARDAGVVMAWMVRVLLADLANGGGPGIE